MSDFSRLESMYPDWDRFVDSYAVSPYYLSGFLRSYFVESVTEAKRRRRFVVMMKEGGKPVGLAAFQINESYILWRPRLFEFRTAQFLLPDSWSPDFVAQPDRRIEFVERALSLLFDRLGCRSVSLTLASDSPTVPILTDWCEKRKMALQRHPHPRHPWHATVRVQGTWEVFLKSLGKKYIQNYRRSEHRLDEAGSWRVTCQRVDNQSVVDKVLEIDRHSWKQTLRNERGESDDPEMARILDFHLRTPGSEFCPLAWFLELNGKPIAFALVMILGGIAYQPNASYNASYRYLAPGKVLDMKMFQDTFAKGQVKRMEFFTSHDYMKAWAPQIKRRDTFVIENHRGPFKMLLALRRSKLVADLGQTLTERM